MTRGIFDPTGGDAEHSGSAFTGPESSDISHLPLDVVNGEAEADDDTPEPFAADADEAAARLLEMTEGESPEADGDRDSVSS